MWKLYLHSPIRLHNVVLNSSHDNFAHDLVGVINKSTGLNFINERFKDPRKVIQVFELRVDTHYSHNITEYKVWISGMIN
jgi:hypothetical protein